MRESDSDSVVRVRVWPAPRLSLGCSHFERTCPLSKLTRGGHQMEMEILNIQCPEKSEQLKQECPVTRDCGL